MGDGVPERGCYHPSVVVSQPQPRIDVVILTMGDRPTELRAALDSALTQTDVAVEITVVANGVGATSIDVGGDERARVVESTVNLGIPGGRNLGADASSAALIAFLDDDARFVTADVLSRTATEFAADPALGAVALRIVDEQGESARRHQPRVGARDPSRSGDVAGFLGGAVVVRRAAFEQVGGYAAEFGYAMEETDLALRMVDRGWRIRYDGTPAVLHPHTDPSRHPGAAERTMRNRVWLAYRNLPGPLGVVYVANWLVIASIRRPRDTGAVWRGALTGWRTRPRGERAPIAWRTVARLARLGRPPIV